MDGWSPRNKLSNTPAQTWTYNFQMKDQIGSFFYFPTLAFQKAAGGYGPIRVHNRHVIKVPFDRPFDEFDVLIGDWFVSDYRVSNPSNYNSKVWLEYGVRISYKVLLIYVTRT